MIKPEDLTKGTTLLATLGEENFDLGMSEDLINELHSIIQKALDVNNNWIDAKDKPESGKSVLIAYHTKLGKTKVTLGFYASKHSLECTFEDFGYEEDYCEEKDEYFITEGWYDCSKESEYRYSIDNVTHWMELEKHPNYKK